MHTLIHPSFRTTLVYVLLLGSLLSLSAAEPIRLLSYNIRHGQGMDGKLDLKRTAEVIEKERPDLVALQEVDKECTRSGNVDQAAELGRLLEMESAFGTFMPFQGGEYGLAILSRFPIQKVVRHLLPEGAEPRCALEVIVQPPGMSTPLSFICIHNDWTDHALRTPQINALLEDIAQRKHPVVLAGDFNGERQDPSLRPFIEPTWVVSDKNGGKTFPANDPQKEIDYFIGRDLKGKLSATTVVDEKLASDHRPIRAVILPGAD
jgi:endonuclease/exonuclease/phosphatase family metal-dependent hydrolase